MAMWVSKLIVMGAEAATMVCLLAIPAAAICVWKWPMPPSAADPNLSGVASPAVG